MDYRNADGSVAEMCGNGVRVYARYLVEAGLVPAGPMTLATRGGVKQVEVHPATLDSTARAYSGGRHGVDLTALDV